MSKMRAILAVLILAGFVVSGCEPAAEAPAKPKVAAAEEPKPTEAKAAAPVNKLRSDGLVAEWSVVVFSIKVGGDRDAPPEYFRGTFDKDYLASVGGEAKVVLAPGLKVAYKDEAGKDQTAKAALAKTDSIGWLSSEYDEAGLGRKIPYAFCYLSSDKPQKVKCYFGSDDEAKIWLNGKVVHETYVDRSCEDRSDTFNMELKKGLNPLMVKTSQRTQSWVFVLEAHAAK